MSVELVDKLSEKSQSYESFNFECILGRLTVKVICQDAFECCEFSDDEIDVCQLTIAYMVHLIWLSIGNIEVAMDWIRGKHD